MFYSPRLRSYIKMAWFRVGLVNRLCGEYTRSLEQQVVVVDQEVECLPMEQVQGLNLLDPVL